MRKTFAVVTLLLGATLAASPASAQTCYDQMKQLRCFDHGKCNIKFINRTASGSGLSEHQTSRAKTVLVEALDAGKRRVGSQLEILAGASATMNLEKKNKDQFETIRIKFPSERNAMMQCDQILAVLRGNGICKVYVSERGEENYLNVEALCDGGNVRIR